MWFYCLHANNLLYVAQVRQYYQYLLPKHLRIRMPSRHVNQMAPRILIQIKFEAEGGPLLCKANYLEQILCFYAMRTKQQVGGKCHWYESKKSILINWI